MEIKINNVLYTSLAAMRGEVQEDVVNFLTEWYNDQPDIIGHTSGSTGVPKPISLLKRDMQASARLTNQFLGLDERSTLLLCLSPSYIAGKMMIVRAIEAGAHLIVVSPSSTPLCDINTPITMAAMVPMQVAETLRCADGQKQLANVTQLLVGGAPVDEELERQLVVLPTVTYVTYGMTETVSHVALRRVGETSYTAIGDVTFTTDNRSCLVIDAPQLSGRRFITNDVVELIDGFRFKWLGRYDNVIMSGGLKFCAEQLEEKIAHLLPERFYITAAPDERLGQHVVLMIEGQAYTDDRLRQLREDMSQCLTRYEMPRDIRFLERFQETSSGKVKRLR